MTISETPRSRRSFTLMELMLALLIMAMLAAVVYPPLRAVQRRAHGEAARFELLRLLRQARWWSVQTGRTCRVRLVSTEDGCAVEVTHTDGAGRRATALKADWTALEQRPRIVSLLEVPTRQTGQEDEELTVVFTPSGVCADYIIGLAGPTGRAGRIEIRRPSGMAWLVSANAPAGLTPESLARIEDYWQSHCRKAGR